MTIENLKPRVISMPRPSIVSKTKDGQETYASAGHLLLIPGMNSVSDEDAVWLLKNPGIERRVKAGELRIHDGADDPLSGSVEKVVAGVGQTLDRGTLESLREKDSRKKVREAIDAQLAKLTDHRPKGDA